MLSTNRLIIFSLTLSAALAQMPDGAGKQETQKICSQCHEVERSISLHQDRDGWKTTMNKMVALGAEGSDQDFQMVFEYLVRNYPAEQVPKVNVNTATAIELESGLTLRRSQAAQLIAYRTRNGSFKSLEDLKKIPGIDPGYLESKKDRIAF
jgi:competence protein ComEA